MKLLLFEYASPATLAEAVALLAASGGSAKAIAGGQGLIPTMAFRPDTPSMLVDLRRLPGLDRIATGKDGVRLGAKVRWRDIEHDARLKTAFRKHHALQCGFCNPGMLIIAHALLAEEPDASGQRIREVLSGNLCRCTGYIAIVEAVHEACAAYQLAKETVKA